MKAAVSLEQCIDIHRWLEHDQGLPLQERIRRDRAIGRTLRESRDDQKVLAWWHAVNKTELSTSRIPGERHAGNRVVAVRRWISITLAVLGVVTGGSLCSVALAYEGDYPVNLLAFLGVIVGLPVLMLLFTVFSFVWRLFIKRGSTLTPLTHGFSLNRWLLGVWDRLGGVRLGAGYGQADARGRFAAWQLMWFSQLFSVGFFVGVLSMFGLLIAVTDIAFGWSTTLDIQSHTILGWFSSLAWVWNEIWPSAVPNAELVDASRFYRLAADMETARVAQLGLWWPFVLMCVLVWGLLPRAIALVLSLWRLRRATSGMLREHSEVTALLDRLQAAAVDLGDQHSQVAATTPQPAADTQSVVPISNLPGSVLVVYNDALQGQASLQSGNVIHVGSRHSEAENAQHLAALPAQPNGVTVLVKSWEPPVLEFMDMLQGLRRQLGTEVSIVVTPLGLHTDDFLATTEEIVMWSAAVAALGDPRIYVVQSQADSGSGTDEHG